MKIVLVHGLWNRAWSMAGLAKRLRAKGHTVHVFSYPTRANDIAGHADGLHQFVQKHVSGEFSMVGHSLGGLVILSMLNRYPDVYEDDLSVQRVVLMASPVQGSSLVKRLAILPGQKLLFGQVRGVLLDGYQKRPNGCQIGMITGTRSFGLGRVAGKHAEINDGSVLVSETLMPGLTDRVELAVAHSEMLISPLVAEQVEQFLESGQFNC